MLINVTVFSWVSRHTSSSAHGSTTIDTLPGVWTYFLIRIRFKTFPISSKIGSDALLTHCKAVVREEATVQCKPLIIQQSNFLMFIKTPSMAWRFCDEYLKSIYDQITMCTAQSMHPHLHPRRCRLLRSPPSPRPL